MDGAIVQRIAGWERADEVMTKERARRLAAMTADEAKAIAEDLLSLAGSVPPKSEPCGLIEQQRIFARLHG